jgi:hypothetical protein
MRGCWLSRKLGLNIARDIRNVWWAREDSNLQPSGYEPLALTIELRARANAGDNARDII